MAIDVSRAFVTVTASEPVVLPTVAVIVVEPVVTPWTSPLAFTAAVEELVLVKVDEAVRFALLPSV